MKPKIGESIQFLGEITEGEKDRLISKAYCLVHCATNEAMGLTIIEASLRGTPVVALNRGAMPEVVKNGYSGFLCDSIDEMVKKVEETDEIEPQDCRDWGNNFSVERMASDYEKIYEKLLNGQGKNTDT